MNLYELTNGMLGESYVRAYAWASNPEEAQRLYREKNGAPAAECRLCFRDSEPAFCTPTNDHGWPSPKPIAIESPDQPPHGTPCEVCGKPATVVFHEHVEITRGAIPGEAPHPIDHAHRHAQGAPHFRCDEHAFKPISLRIEGAGE